MKNWNNRLMGVLLAAAFLTGCVALPPSKQQADGKDWRILRQDAAVEVSIRPDAQAQLRVLPQLGQIKVAADNVAADEQTLLASKLSDALGAHLAAAGKDGPTLNVRLLQPKAPSMTWNFVSSLLVIVPLDTGSVIVESELVSAAGERIASWREVVKGEYLDFSGAFSRWGRIHNALDKWAERCAQHPAWSPAGDS